MYTIVCNTVMQPQAHIFKVWWDTPGDKRQESFRQDPPAEEKVKHVTKTMCLAHETFVY